MFTGSYPNRGAGEYLYLTEEQGEGGEAVCGRPSAGRLEYEIEFSGLPEEMQERTLDAYRVLWNL